MNRIGRDAITKTEAVEILASAVAYCQQAGIPIKLGANNGTLWIALEGVGFQIIEDDKSIKFVVETPCPCVDKNPL